ncbi:MAG: AsmA family protein [Gammaproteobacteria bacterium]|nr:AsmA family protein [Gammaproteobacteria bacterium]
MRRLIVTAAVLVTLLVTLAAVAVAAAALYLDGDRLRMLAVQYAERQGGVRLEIESVERTVGLSPRIEVRNLRVREPRFEAAPLLVVEYAAFNADLLSFLFGRATLRDLAVEAPEIVLPVADEGVLYWGPALADFMRRVRRFEWAVHGFSISRLSTEARHTVEDAQVLISVDSIEGTMPRIAQLTFEARDIGGELQTTLPIPTTGSVRIERVRLFHTESATPVRLEIDGSIGPRTLRVAARSGNVLAGQAQAREPLHAVVELEQSVLRVDGTISRGADPHFDLQVDAAARNLPSFPSSDVQFALSDRGDAWHVNGLEATIGDASASGDLRIERRDPRPLLTGSLSATGVTLASADGADGADSADEANAGGDADEANAGGDADGANAAGDADGANAAGDDGGDSDDGDDGGDGGSASENADGAARNGPPGMFQAVLERLDVLDAELDLAVESMQLYALPVDRISARAELSDGRLELPNVDAQLLAGDLTGSVTVVGAASPPEFRLTSRFDGLETSELSDALGIDRDVFGDIEGDVELRSAGAEPGAIVDSAGGRVTLFMNGGRLSAALAQLADMDLAGALLERFDADETTPIRCAVADFEGSDGVFEVKTLLVDTGTVKLVGAGEIDLADRRLDLAILGRGKDFSLLSADAPVHVTGPLGDPSVTPDKGEIVESLLTPIELGDADSADCRALLEQVQAAAEGGA